MAKIKTLKHARGRFYSIGARCTNPKTDAYKYYGARGIKRRLTVLDIHYLWVRDHAADMVRPSIDRIDPKGDYTLENCRFIPLSENSRRANQARINLKRSFDALERALKRLYL